MARLAKAAYDPHDSVDGHNYLPELSNDEFSVYQKGNNIVLAVRGSAVASDFVIDDFQIASGQIHNQVARANEKLTELENKFRDANIVATGHSLGGATASYLSRDRGILGYGYNPGSGPLHSTEDQKSRYGNDKFAVVHQKGDWISAASLKHAKNRWVLADTEKANKHTVDNFIPHDTIEKIHKHLATTRNDAGIIARQLHNKDFSDDQLTKKLSNLTAGGDIAINEGPFLGGGYHAQYEPKKFITIEGSQVPAPGAQVFFRDDGSMYCFDKQNKFLSLHGTLQQRSEQLKSAKGYNEGPTIIVKESNPEDRVALVSAMGGQGFDVVPVRNKQEYKYALGGLGLTGGLDAWSGKTSGRYVGNGAVNIFLEKPPNTADDVVGNIGATVGETLLDNSVMILETAAEAAIDVLSGGILAVPAELMFQTLDLADSIAGLATGQSGSYVQSRVSSLLPDQRHYNIGNTDIFKVTKNAVGSHKPDQAMMRDDRVDYAKIQLQSVYENIRNKARQFDMSVPEEVEFHKFNVDNITSLEGAQKWDLRMLELNEKLDALDSLQTLDKTAQRIGVREVTETAYKNMRQSIFDEKQHPREAVHLAESLRNELKTVTRQKLASAQQDYQGRFDQETGFGNQASQDILNKIVTKDAFREVWNPADNFETEYQQYRRDAWADYKHYKFAPTNEIEQTVVSRKYKDIDTTGMVRERDKQILAMKPGARIFTNTNIKNNAPENPKVSTESNK